MKSALLAIGFLFVFIMGYILALADFHKETFREATKRLFW